MKAFLMHKDRDFGTRQALVKNYEISQDLELRTLFNAMSGGDEFLSTIAERALLAGLGDPGEITYRQQVLADCIEHAGVIRRMYGIVSDALDRERQIWSWLSFQYAEGTLRRSIEVMELFLQFFRNLRSIADEHASSFRSEGMTRFFSMLRGELDDEYLAVVDEHLERLRFKGSLLMSASLGKGNKGTNYVLLKPPEMARRNRLDKLQGWATESLPSKDRYRYVYEIADRDEAGFRALSELRSRGIGHVAAALAQSVDHIKAFFGMVRLELGFYVGCLNLRERLVGKGEPVCFPQPARPDEVAFSCQGLYDVCLSLSAEHRAIGNDVAADGKTLALITGANRGGKSTFLRSVGLGQLMMQCGMFVPAESFSASLCKGLFSHFKREEDATMRHGKLDEELSRMSGIVDRLVPGGIVLLNESFAATNEREGSEIARRIIRAFLDSGVRVFCVTHMFDLASGFHKVGSNDYIFLRAERLDDGTRTFRLLEGEPLPTSYGEDLYRRIFARELFGAVPGSDRGLN